MRLIQRLFLLTGMLMPLMWAFFYYSKPQEVLENAPPATPVAVSAPTHTMTFTYAENGGNCSGCSFILADGEISPDTPALFTSFMVALRKEFPASDAWPLYLNSPGGSITAAMSLGELIRSNNINTAVGHAQRSTDPADGSAYDFLDSAACRSACVLAFAGGVHRFYGDASRSGPRWYVGLGHQIISLKGLSDDIAREINRDENKNYLSGISDGLQASKKLIEYISQMGVDLNLISSDLTNPTRPDEPLSEKQAYDIRLTNIPTPPLVWTITQARGRSELRTSLLVENRNVHYRFFCSSQSSSRLSLSIEIEKMKFISRTDIDQHFNTANWKPALTGPSRFDIAAEIIRTEMQNDTFRTEIGISQNLMRSLTEGLGLVLEFDLPMSIARDFPILEIHSPDLGQAAPQLLRNCPVEQSRPNRTRR